MEKCKQANDFQQHGDLTNNDQNWPNPAIQGFPPIKYHFTVPHHLSYEIFQNNKNEGASSENEGHKGDSECCYNQSIIAESPTWIAHIWEGKRAAVTHF